jgi:hypothetical protein
VICPKCKTDITGSYVPADPSLNMLGGWYCDGCNVAIHELEVPREPMAADVEIMSACEDLPVGAPLSELSTQPGPKDDLGHPDSVSADSAIAESSEQSPPVAPAVATANRDEAVIWNIGIKRANLSTAAPSRPYFAPVLLIAALALGAVGITINGWFARSLGSTAVAGWLFLAVGVAADLVALILPSTAAGLWQARQRVIALVGWIIWLVTFVFAVTASIGFASTNISDVSLARAARITPAITSAQAELADAMAARDRECKGGVGKFCRQREQTVTDKEQALADAMKTVESAADPQTEAARRIVAWVSFGALHPTADDFAMLRLVLLALLPQIGGMLLLIGRRSQTTGERRHSPLSAGRRTGWARIIR